MKISEPTCTTLFLIPPLGLSAMKMRKAGFINAYVADSGREDACEHPVYLLFNIKKTDASRQFQVLVNELEDLIVDEYDYAEDYVVIVLPFPAELGEDYNKFLQGKYSSFSERMKQIYPKKLEIPSTNIFNKEKFGTAHSIVYKKPWLKEFREHQIGMSLSTVSELWSRPCFDEETIDEDILLSFKIDK